MVSYIACIGNESCVQLHCSGYFKIKINKNIILEVACDQSLWVWHALFGLSGSNNDLNVLDRSPLVRKLVEDNANSVGFWVNGNWYEKYYLLAEGIYLKWSCFVQSLQKNLTSKLKNYVHLEMTQHI